MNQDQQESFMVYVAGSKSSFRCGCGCNVFGKSGDRYICNSCGALYHGESR